MPKVSAEQTAPATSEVSDAESPREMCNTTQTTAAIGATKKTVRNLPFRIAALIAWNACTYVPSSTRRRPGLIAILNTKNSPASNPLATIATTSSGPRSEEHTSELQSRFDIVCRHLLEKKKRFKK